MSLGTGYEYLLRSVARGDVELAASSPLTRYYAETGTPPGRFLGAGLAGLGNGSGVVAGSVVSEGDLFRLLGMLQDPLTGTQLGATPMRPRAGSTAKPVAGFDLTFSVPKSVSAVWAVADTATQGVIYRAHQDAIVETIRWAERKVFFSRTGRGGAVQSDVRGVVAAAFDHWDSRAGDPHLHTHVVVANRAQGVDRKWRSLDSRTLFGYVVALSELHEGVLTDLLSERLGYWWDERARPHSAIPRHDIAGVPDGLIGEFSRRSSQIESSTADLVEAFVSAHGRHPSDAQMLRLRQQATLQTRPEKQQYSLQQLTEQWRQRARIHVGSDTVAWASRLGDRIPLPAVRSAQLEDAMLREAGAIALRVVAEKRATFGPANVLAEVHRQLHGIRFATPTDRLIAADRTTTLALDQALALTPAPTVPLPAHLLRPDGTSRLRHRGADRYTTRELLDAETRLLDAGREHIAPRVPTVTVAAVIAKGLHDGEHDLGDDQAAAVHAISGSGRTLDLLVGPAGAGKTTTLTALRDAWEQAHGHGTVIGLAPSAAAAQVLADELHIGTDNTAKWLTETDRNPERDERIAALTELIRTTTSSPATGRARRLNAHLHELETERRRWSIGHGQLVVIDEAGLAGTLHLDAITEQARDAGAKVVLVGDWAQLGAVQAGGAFAMLARDRGDTPELTQVHRFTHDWERDASMRLRVGDPSVIDTYTEHDRIRSGDRDTMLDALYTAWRDDTNHGLTSVMIAANRDSVAQLNQRAQTDRTNSGQVSGQRVAIAAGAAGTGDQIVTRHNDRTLRTPAGWVKNGDTFTITATNPDGSLRVQSDNANEVDLPADYVREHVELGYATTAHRVQGRTLDTAHALITGSNTRETLYVAATRGRNANTLYIDTTSHHDEDTSHSPITETPTADVLRRVLNTAGDDTSAHTVLEREHASARETERQLARTQPPPIPPQPWTPYPDNATRRHEIGL